MVMLHPNSTSPWTMVVNVLRWGGGKRAMGKLVTLRDSEPLLSSDPRVQASAPPFPNLGLPVSFSLRPGVRDLISPLLPQTQEPRSPDIQSPVHGSPLEGSSAPSRGSQPHFILCTPSPGAWAGGNFPRRQSWGSKTGSSCRGRGGAEPAPHPLRDGCLPPGSRGCPAARGGLD